MYFYSGPPKQFLSGVDSRVGQAAAAGLALAHPN